jgi:hypothetical protein
LAEALARERVLCLRLEGQDVTSPTGYEQRRSRNWKHVVLFAILLLILAISSAYYVWVFRPEYQLRIDAIPPGAYIVPWMKPSTSFEELNGETLLRGTFDIDSAMTKALKINMTFRIGMWDGTTRVIPSTVYLGHDSQYLYIGGKFVGMYSNPDSDANSTSPECFQVLFDTTDKGVLETPESGSMFGVWVRVPYDTYSGWQYHDAMWVYEKDLYKRMIWMPADNYYSGGFTGSLKDQASGYENSTGTVSMLFSRFLWVNNAQVNALQMRTGERWVMGFLFELWYQKELDNRVDGWPQKTFGVWSSNSSWWPKMVIDLTNPPSTYPGNNQTTTPNGTTY